ncbi:dihydroxyacetone kinase subunit DhaK, partial [Streptomyces eurythermus]
MVDGVHAGHDGEQHLRGTDVARRHPAPGRRVALVSGGGSGHEPLHLGFLGAGML